MGIEDLKDEYERRQEKLDLDINKKFMDYFVKPFCDKYHLTIICGNGTFFLETKRGTPINMYGHPNKRDTAFWMSYTEIYNFFCEYDSISGDDYRGE